MAQTSIDAVLFDYWERLKLNFVRKHHELVTNISSIQIQKYNRHLLHYLVAMFVSGRAFIQVIL